MRQAVAARKIGQNPYGQSEKGKEMKGFIVELRDLNRAEAEICGKEDEKQKGSCER